MSYVVMITFLVLVTGTSVVTQINGSLPMQGTVIPAEIQPCVNCGDFEFLERALQDISTAAYKLDSQTEKLLLRTEERGLCYCIEQGQEAENGICITRLDNAIYYTNSQKYDSQNTKNCN
ncbi:NELL2-interacting cell ontogeny regulator 1 isoform X2 [Pyxicephalus adspersus]